MRKAVFVKLGGSLITEKGRAYTTRGEVIKNLAREIKKVQSQFPDTVIVLGNGAGSYGHYAATKLSSAKKNSEKLKGFALVQSKVKELNSIVVNELLAAGVNAVSVHPSSTMSTKDGKLAALNLDTLTTMIGLGITPVIYGDIVADKTKTWHIFSTEDLFEILIKRLHKKTLDVERVIYLSQVEGVYDVQKKVVPIITAKSFNAMQDVFYKTEGFDVTGGMKHKIERSLENVELGIKTHIVHGGDYGVILKIMGGGVVGTTIS